MPGGKSIVTPPRYNRTIRPLSGQSDTVNVLAPPMVDAVRGEIMTGLHAPAAAVGVGVGSPPAAVGGYRITSRRGRSGCRCLPGGWHRRASIGNREVDGRRHTLFDSSRSRILNDHRRTHSALGKCAGVDRIAGRSWRKINRHTAYIQSDESSAERATRHRKRTRTADRRSGRGEIMTGLHAPLPRSE